MSGSHDGHIDVQAEGQCEAEEQKRWTRTGCRYQTSLLLWECYSYFPVFTQFDTALAESLLGNARGLAETFFLFLY